MSRQTPSYGLRRLLRQLNRLEDQYASLFGEEASISQLAKVYKKIQAVKEKIRQLKEKGDGLHPS